MFALITTGIGCLYSLDQSHNMTNLDRASQGSSRPARRSLSTYICSQSTQSTIQLGAGQRSEGLTAKSSISFIFLVSVVRTLTRGTSCSQSAFHL